MKIAISGAGIAGTVLAYWLKRYGHEPVLIEAAPQLRTGGYIIDFWGLGLTVTERMGLFDAVMATGYKAREVRFVGDDNRKLGGFSTDAIHELTKGRFTTIRRGALVELFYQALEGRVETIFGDQIVALQEDPNGVSVTLESGAERQFDLVIGADGIHSAVRRLAFGAEEVSEVYLGYAVAAFEVTGYRPRDEDVYVIHPTPSHLLARFALREDRTLFLLIFKSEPGPVSGRLTAAQIREILRSEFRHTGWEAQDILAAMDGVDDIYFDRMSQTHLPCWHKGRVALVGDAAAAVSLLAGEGTGLGITEAYVLAGEIARANGDYRRAFDAFDGRLRSFLREKQKTAAQFASTFVPTSEFGIWARNQATKIMSLPGVPSFFLGRSFRDELELPAYET